MFGGRWMAVMAVLMANAATPVAFGGENGALADASMNGDVSLMHTLLKERADPNAPGAFGTPALHWRVHEDDLAEAKRLTAAWRPGVGR